MADFYIEGQRALEILKRDVHMNTIRQGYILEGAEGIGKKTAARHFANMVFCSGENKPCGECHGCRMFAAGTHPDFFVIEESPVNIKSVRDMNDELFVKPLLADKKVFIVEHAEEMNIAAQNAFLKSFEEPPGYAVIILITSSVQRLLPTILSRGTKISFLPFSEKQIEGFVSEKYSLTGARANFVARYSSGIVGRAVEICENEEVLSRRDGLIEAIGKLSEEKISILPVIEAMGGTTKSMPTDVDLYFDVFTGFFRDVAVMKAGGKIINSDYKEAIEELGGRIKGSSARKIVDIASEIKGQLAPKMKYDLWITNMLIKCWEEIYGTGNRR